MAPVPTNPTRGDRPVATEPAVGTGGGDTGFVGPSGTQRGFAGWFADTGWRHIVAVVALVFALFPVYWVVIGAFDPMTITKVSGNPALTEIATEVEARLRRVIERV